MCSTTWVRLYGARFSTEIYTLEGAIVSRLLLRLKLLDACDILPAHNVNSVQTLKAALPSLGLVLTMNSCHHTDDVTTLKGGHSNVRLGLVRTMNSAATLMPSQH
jgi:hypothetical protein